MSKLALVTGAGGGIGGAIATALAARGAGVIVLDSRQADCSKTAKAIRDQGGTAYEAVADVRSESDLQRARTDLGEVANSVNVLINCAGILRTTPFLEISAGEWRLMLDTHVKGTFLVCKSFLPAMMKQNEGLIINMSSDFAVVGSPGRAHYCAAKRAIHALTKSLALEFAPYRIRAVSIGPGPTDTPMLREGASDSDYEKKLSAIAKRVPLGRAGQPQDIANLAAWLAFGGGRYINGQLLHVNGGTVMH